MKFIDIKIKSFAISILTGSLLLFSGCEDFLDYENPSDVSQQPVFESTSYTMSALVGVYSHLMGDDAYGSRVSVLYPKGGEDFRVGGDYNSLDRRGISGYGVHPDNTEMFRPFLQFYAGIEAANNLIEYIPGSSLFNGGTEEEQKLMRKFLGEALTLRAQFYHELIRNWGDVPAQFQPSALLNDLYLPKTDRDVIYDRLLEDLALAADYVPWRSESGDPPTRISKAAVKGLRARIALARGGYSLRRDPQLMERRSDYKDFYEIARKECRDIIERGENGLNPVYENLFKSLHGHNLDPTNEWIFQVGAFGGNSRSDSKLGYATGIRIADNSKYGKANGGTEAIPTYFYEFAPEGDSRRDVTLAYFMIDNDDNKELTTPLLMRDGKFRKYWTSIAGTNQNLGIDWPILRYADILLMFAEADNELNSGPSGEAVKALEDVRKRAFVGHEDKMGAIPTDYQGFFDAIVHERLLEFGGEGIRKYDLIRWNLLASTIEKTRQNLRDMMNQEGKYANIPTYVYYKKTPFLNTELVKDEIASFDLYGGSVSEVMFKPGPETSTGLEDYVRVSWADAVKEEHITGELKGFAIKFQPNARELFPIYSGVLNQNYNLTQDYDY